MKIINWIKSKPLKACTTFNFFTTVLAFIAFGFVGYKGIYLLALPTAIVLAFSIYALIRAKSFLLGVGDLLAVLITQAVLFGILCAIGFLVALFLSFDPTKPSKWFLGERIENFFESGHFERLNEFGITKKIDSKPIHASYFAIADDYGFDVFFELSNDNLRQFVPESIDFVDRDTFMNEQKYGEPSSHFLCEEDTEALLKNKQLINLVCNDEKVNIRSLHHHQSIPERYIRFNLVYFPDNEILWIHFLRW